MSRFTQYFADRMAHGMESVRIHFIGRNLTKDKQQAKQLYT